MNRQQATEHILNNLRTGYRADEIAEELSHLLQAPRDVTQRFVDHVIASHPEAAQSAQRPPEEEDDRPEWLRSISLDRPLEADSAAKFADAGGLPPGLQALLVENEQSAAESEAEPNQGLYDLPGDDLPTRARFVALSAEEDEAEGPDQTTKVDLDELAEYVMIQLQKQQRHNDIVEGVCYHTGWHWNKSQRFVARVKTKNHEKLQSNQNQMMLFGGTAMMVVGLLIAIGGISQVAEYAKLMVFANTNPAALLSVSTQAILFWLALAMIGIGMVVGGGYGIARALTNHS